MKIIFEMGHPTDVNLFKNIIGELEQRRHDIKIAARDRDETLSLLDAYGLGYDPNIGEYQRGLANKAIGLFKNNHWLYRISRQFKPDIFISPGSPYSAHVSKLFGKPHIAFSDTETANLVIRLMLPFTDIIYTSKSFKKDLGSKHVKFNSYYELAYLHPKYFKPDPSVLEGLNLGKHEKYILLRFSLLESHHDIGISGFNFQSNQEIHEFIKKLEDYARVIITSEKILDSGLKEYTVNIPSHRYLDFVSCATMYIGEGAKTASEAAILGVPSIYVSTSRRGYIDELEDVYGLACTATNREQAIEKAVELLEDKDLENKWKGKREKLLSEKVDITKFMVNAIEEYPKKLYE